MVGNNLENSSNCLFSNLQLLHQDEKITTMYLLPIGNCILLPEYIEFRDSFDRSDSMFTLFTGLFTSFNDAKSSPIKQSNIITGNMSLNFIFIAL